MCLPSSRRALVALVAIVLHASFSAGTTKAAGFGAFFEYGRDTVTTNGTLEVLSSITGVPPSAFDRNSFGVGLATDTNLARNKLFNNRFDIGFHASRFANLDADGGVGLMVNNAFGFGLYRRKSVRLWFGPAVRLNSDWYGSNDVVDVQVGWGPQVGLNVHLGENLTSTLTFAYNYKWGWWLDGSGANVEYTDNYLGVGLAFFFRTPGDQY